MADITRTIISQDTTAGTARIRFELNDVTVEADYALINVIPGTQYVLNAMGLTFDETYQAKAIDYLTQSIQRGIEDGLIVNQHVPEEVTPAEPEADTPAAPEAE